MSLQRWFEVYATCQEAIRSGDSLEIESAKLIYQKAVNDMGDPPIDRAAFGIFPDPCPPQATGASVSEAKSTGPQRVGEALEASGGAFGLLYRLRRGGCSKVLPGHPPKGLAAPTDE